ncbi:Imidazole glycerol phosphate synthase hisHF, chloroplastic [Zea mays]|uniref:Imidazole glycerol phosphate synthase hisHF, chloroplastic n=1 Tax=Zea mays TaxID=4577 RepID=A0A3L6DYT2_MAIZE|nr:Imidazole glycerol phosphate synthase hisHF, chloroplastic [Zea mays]
MPNADLEDLSLEPEGRIVFKYYHYELLYNAIQFYAFVPAILFCTTQKVVQVSQVFAWPRAIYEEPGKYGSIENELLCYQCIEEVEPMIDLCSHKLGGSYLQAHELLDTANDLLNEDGCGLEGCVLLGFDIRDVQSPEDIVAAERLVFPGVGAFGSAMDVLNRTGMADALREYIQRDRPFLGICLGLQLLFDSSEENGPVSGLGVIPGVVRRFDSSNGLIVPHIGWNALQITKDTPLLQGADGQHVYFVHSYHVLPSDANRDWISSICNYGDSFISSISMGNIQAVQFHPEKSGATELSILKEFLRPNSLGTKNEGDEMASKVAFDHPERFSEKFEFSADNIKPLVQTCMTTLSSKISACFRRNVWLGDLNYRINLPYEKTHELISKQDWNELFGKDQLKVELKKGIYLKDGPKGSSTFLQRVHVHNLVIEQSLVSQSTEFEAAIQNGDKSSLRALSDEERETWGFLRVMFEDGDFARTKLLAHLGFEPPQAPPASSTNELSQILADTLNIDHAAVTDNADAQFLIDNGDDFFNNPQPSEASLAEESVSTNGQQIEQEVPGDAVPSDPSIDKSIQHALVVGDYKGAVNQCLASNRMADALVIAHAGGSALWESTRNHYLKNSISPYLKVSFYFRF